jgi:hypothetical protein
MNEEQDTGWCLIPPQIIAREDLSANEKIIFGRIMGLTKRDGYCWASNSWLGQQVGVASITVSHIVNILKEKGLIRVTLLRKNKKITTRHIFITLVPDHYPKEDSTTIRERIDPLSAIGQGSVDVSVENSDSTSSDKIAEKLQTLKEKHEKKNHSLMGSPFENRPQYPPRKERKYIDGSGIL